MSDSDKWLWGGGIVAVLIILIFARWLALMAGVGYVGFMIARSLKGKWRKWAIITTVAIEVLILGGHEMSTSFQSSTQGSTAQSGDKKIPLPPGVEHKSVECIPAELGETIIPVKQDEWSPDFCGFEGRMVDWWPTTRDGKGDYQYATQLVENTCNASGCPRPPAPVARVRFKANGRDQKITLYIK